MQDARPSYAVSANAGYYIQHMADSRPEYEDYPYASKDPRGAEGNSYPPQHGGMSPPQVRTVHGKVLSSQRP